MNPTFYSEKEGKEWLIKRLEELINNYENAKNHLEKLTILKNFKIQELDAEEQFIFKIKINQFEEYKAVKSIIKDFFEWLKIKENLNAGIMLYKNSFYTENQNQKMLSSATSILGMPINEREQFEFILNLTRKLYELNLQSLIVILEFVLEKKNRKKNKDYGLFEFGQEFKDYPKIEELKSYFKPYLRNPSTHESWIVKDGKIITRNKGQEETRELVEYLNEIHYLLFFKTAMQSCSLEEYTNIINRGQISEEELDDIYKKWKEGIAKLKNSINSP